MRAYQRLNNGEKPRRREGVMDDACKRHGRVRCDECAEMGGLRARLAEAEAAKPKCKWSPDDPYYGTSCGHEWQFIDGDVAENGVKFCPFCGGEIELPRCSICGETECDLEHCADCGKWFCDQCGDWCCNPDDEADGDYFCVDCQDGTSREEG